MTLTLTLSLSLAFTLADLKSQRKEAVLQNDLFENKAHVNDLQLSLKQAVSVHVVAERESKKKLRLLLSPYLHLNPDLNISLYFLIHQVEFYGD